jgi:hypothetical protein
MLYPCQGSLQTVESSAEDGRSPQGDIPLSHVGAVRSTKLFSGSVEIEDVKEEKPAWVGRLRKEGRLERAIMKSPALWYRVVYFVFGYSALVFGVYLLVNGIVYSRYIRLH